MKTAPSKYLKIISILYEVDMFGLNNYLAPYTPSQFVNRPFSGTVDEMYNHWPQWQAAMDMAQNCMASLTMNGFYKGLGVFLAQDVLLIPKHLINGNGFICGANLDALMKNIQIDYSNAQYCYGPMQVTGVIEEGGEMDYCMLKLAAKVSCMVPQMSFNSNHSECLFAEIRDSQFKVSIVSPCQGSQGSMCASISGWTKPGSSGGIYLDQSGQLVGIHLGQSTGVCNWESGEERRILFVADLIKHSAYLCTLDKAFHPIQTPSCLWPVQHDICYAQQKDIRVSSKKNVSTIKNISQEYICNAKELHITNAERGVQIDVKQMVQDPSKRKPQIKQVASLSYQLFLVEGKNERPNIHNNKGSPSSYTKENAVAFYTTITELFQNHINGLHEAKWPASFKFSFKKFSFIAHMI